MVIPNAIRVYMNNGHDILFGSFIERDPCYNMLAASIEAEKHYSLIKAEADDRTACDDTATQKLSALQSLLTGLPPVSLKASPHLMRMGKTIKMIKM